MTRMFEAMAGNFAHPEEIQLFIIILIILIIIIIIILIILIFAIILTIILIIIMLRQGMDQIYEWHSCGV